MSAVSVPLFRVYDLPWSQSAEDDRRFKRIARGIMLALLLLGLVIPWLPVPESLKDGPPDVPDRYARLLLERKPPPPPPVARVEPEKLPPVELPPEPVRETPAPPEPRPEPRVEAQPVEPAPAVTAEAVEKARETASKAGVMAFSDALADLQQNSALAAVTSDTTLAAAAGASTANERSLITSRTGSASSGINTANLSRNTGGSGLAGRSTTQVASTLAGNGTGKGAAGAGAEGTARGGGIASRSREEIEIVFDRNKGSLYSIYNRALRKDPTLQGKVVLTLTISPDGRVTDCSVVSSEVGDPDFERKLVARILLFQFEAKDVATVTTTKPIDFFPA